MKIPAKSERKAFSISSGFLVIGALVLLAGAMVFLNQALFWKPAPIIANAATAATPRSPADGRQLASEVLDVVSRETRSARETRSGARTP